MNSKKTKKSVADSFELTDEIDTECKKSLRVSYIGMKKRCINLRVDYGNLNSISVDLSSRQADQFMKMLLCETGYGVDAPESVSILGKRERGKMRGLEIRIPDSNLDEIDFWIVQQHYGPLIVFSEFHAWFEDVCNLIQWLAPRLGWELEDE